MLLEFDKVALSFVGQFFKKDRVGYKLEVFGSLANCVDEFFLVEKPTFEVCVSRVDVQLTLQKETNQIHSRHRQNKILLHLYYCFSFQK